jgi:hypothetical protein
MRVSYDAKNIEASSVVKISVEEVSQCPICKKSIKPVHLSSMYYFVTTNNFNMESHLLCRGCNHSFLANYKIVYTPSNNTFAGNEPYYVAPNEYIKSNFDDYITNISPAFVEIFNQASAAESYYLDQIAGIGYRKAIEFLIKDYLIKTYPAEQEEIEKLPLGKCISDKIDNDQLKIAASRATWLGNDQTHYVQKFDDKDINDLKRLIRLTVHWVSMLLETKEVEQMEPR